MRGSVTLPRDNHYRSTIATWTRDLCTFTGCLMDKTGEKRQSRHIAMVFKGLSIHIARFNSQSRTGGGGAYSRDKNTSARTLAENGRGAYTREGAYSWDTTVLGPMGSALHLWLKLCH